MLAKDWFIMLQMSSNRKEDMENILFLVAIRFPLIEAVNLMKRVLNFLDMKMLCPLNVDARSNDDYDILQAITESHIAFHTNKQKMDVDIFSCRSFSSTVLDLFRNVYNIQTIQRGWLLGRNGVYEK